MAEVISNLFLRLFEIRLLHHYWLDDGGTLFDLMPEQEQSLRLLSYDMRRFIDLAPTPATATRLAGLGCLYKETSLGGIVAVPRVRTIPLDTVLDFALTVKDAAFHNYTALTLCSRKISEIFYKPEKKTYRYKENVPLLTNLTGASRATASGKTLFLSKEIPPLAADDQVESLVVSGSALLQLTSDQPGAATQQLNANVTTVPVFVNQGDVPAIVPPPGLSGAPARGVELSQDLPDNLFALLRLSAVRGDDGDFSFVDNSGNPKAAAPVFQVRFKNRSTVWRYLHNTTGIVISQEPAPLPLTFFGNAGTKQKPSAGLVKPVKVADRVTEIISEVFV